MPRLKKSAKKSAKIARMSHEMDKWKRGEMHSGSKKGPVVKSHKQAVAIGLSESGQSNKQRKKVGKLKKSRGQYGHHARKVGRKKTARKRA